MKAVLDDDMIIGLTSGVGVDGVDIPEKFQSVPPERLRYSGGKFSDAAKAKSFYISDDGLKHIKSGTGRQKLSCAWGDMITNDSGKWRVVSAGEAMAPQVYAECQRRIFAVASSNAQMNMASEQGRFTDAERADYYKGLDWVKAMRAKCSSLIEAADETFREDKSWPKVPAGISALAQKY